MGLSPHPSLEGYYEWNGLLANSQGVLADTPECDVCHDARYVKVYPSLRGDRLCDLAYCPKCVPAE